jgi:hypothetical protein
VSKLLPDWIGEVKQSYEGDSLAEEVKKSISEARGGQDGWEEEEGQAGDASVRCDPRSVCEPERRYGTRNQLVTLPSYQLGKALGTELQAGSSPASSTTSRSSSVLLRDVALEHSEEIG